MALQSDALSVLGNLETGILTGKVLFSKVALNDQALPYDDVCGTLSSAINAEVGEKGRHIVLFIDRSNNATNWVFNFEIENQSSVPIRFLPPIATADPGLEVTYILPGRELETDNRELEPGDSRDGQIGIKLLTDEPGNYNFQIAIKCIQWNAFNNDLGWWTDTLLINGTVVVEPPPVSASS